MIYFGDYHTHTDYSDAKNTPEDMVKVAVALGLRSYGITDHAPFDFYTDWAMSAESVDKYKSEFLSLKKKYGSLIELYCGIEVDVYSPEMKGFDYIIGSRHFINKNGNYLSLDLSAEETEKNVREEYSGNYYAYCRDYYEGLCDVVTTTNADIVGHFDLITKFNENGKMFDESDTRYRDSALSALRVLANYGKPFEINTGAISRGYRTTPYPAPFILRELSMLGGRIILNSDAHSTDSICSGFDTARELALFCGFKSSVVINNGEFIETTL